MIAPMVTISPPLTPVTRGNRRLPARMIVGTEPTATAANRNGTASPADYVARSNAARSMLPWSATIVRISPRLGPTRRPPGRKRHLEQKRQRHLTRRMLISDQSASLIEEGDAHDADLVESKNDHHRATDAPRPVAVAGDHGGRGRECPRGSQRHAQRDENERCRRRHRLRRPPGTPKRWAPRAGHRAMKSRVYLPKKPQ